MRIVLLVLCATVSGQLMAIGWPVAPMDSVHPLGNNWGEYQNYGSDTGYYHNGIDVFPRQQGDPCLAVDHGWVKAWGTISAEYHYRLAISDSPPGITSRTPGWLYAHIDPERSHKNIGDEVNVGDTIGFLVPWPVIGFDHCHFARISDTGTTWNRFPSPTWWFIENPLLLMQPLLDTLPPAFQDASSGRRFAFCRNNTDSYFNDLNALVGDVDIVARCHDETGVPTIDPIWDRLIPYKFEWSVRGSRDSVPTTLGLIFSGRLPSSWDVQLTGVSYKERRPYKTLGDYESRDYFFIVTNNSDGDSTVTVGDTSGCWHTADLTDDDYWVKVVAYDVIGNRTSDSIRVRTANGNGIAEIGYRRTPGRIDLASVAHADRDLPVSVTLTASEPVRLDVYGVSGRLERSIHAGQLEAGTHQLNLAPMSAGTRLLVVTIGQDRMIRRLNVVR